jgi:hypothetical protein
MSTIVYRYGIAAPHEGSDLVRAQMQLAHRYRNVLVEIERGRRAALRDLEARLGRDVAIALDETTAADAALARELSEARKDRQRTGLRRNSADHAARISAARVAKREATALLREARRKTSEMPEMIVAQDEIRARASDLTKSAAAYSGLSWGTKALVVEAAAKSFAETPMYDASGVPLDPRYVRASDAQEAIGVQLQGGLSVSDLLGGQDTQLQITPPDGRAWSSEERRCDRRRWARQAEVRIRVISDGRRPVWAVFRLDMDCALPSGAIVMMASIHLQRVGPHAQWCLLLTLRVPDGAYARRAERHARVGGAVSVDLGWRALDEAEARAGYWLGEDGRGDSIEVDAATLRLLRLPRVIASERAVALDRMRWGLAWWLAWGPAPAWLRERCSYLHQWRSPRRLIQLFVDWQRHDGDEPIRAALESYCAHDRHQWAQEEHLRQRAIRRRRELYRVLASRLAQEYDELVLERFDLRSMARASAVDVGEREGHAEEGSSAMRQLIAPSVLREALVGAFRARGKTVTAVPAEDTTRIHAGCGVVEDRPVERSIYVMCTGCGQRFDQDRNACKVLLARRREQSSGVKKAAPARSAGKESDVIEMAEDRWVRARRKRAEREARVTAAREVLAKSAEG